MEIARERGLPALVIPSKGVPREEYDRRVVAELRNRGVELVCLAGFMRLLSAEFCRALPSADFEHSSVFAARLSRAWTPRSRRSNTASKISGCTVHFVDEQLDAGPIILQAAVPVLDDDTAETLSERILD